MQLNLLKTTYLLLITLIFHLTASNAEELNPKLLESFELAKKMPVWKYPYESLIKQLKEDHKKTLLIFTYGSLMNIDSARQTLSIQSVDSHRPAIAYGIIRLFDRDVPIKEGSKWPTPENPLARGMLNVFRTGSLLDFVNGVLLEVTIDDLEPMMEREVGYDLIPVVVEDWDKAFKADDSSFQIAYTFCAPQNSEYTSPHILPRPGYYELTRDAAKQYGTLFYLLWFKTTFFADKKSCAFKDYTPR